MKTRYAETYFSREHQFAIGIDRKAGGYYLAIPVSNGVVDYDEQYRITPEQYQSFSADLASALSCAGDFRAAGPGRGIGQLKSAMIDRITIMMIGR